MVVKSYWWPSWLEKHWKGLKRVSYASEQYVWMRWLFLRGLGIASLIAFISFWVQMEGLIGQAGILPVDQFLSLVAEQLGTERYFRLPTLAWFGGGDIALHVMAGTGVVSSVLLIFNIAPAVSVLFIWGMYLSLSVAGQVFMQYQWDNLLIEMAFAALFIAPWQWWPSGKNPQKVNLVSVWVLRLLLFKLIFESGLVKLVSGDPTWSGFTALEYHFFTQPLPTIFGWFAHQLPDWTLKAATFLSLVIEIGAPLLIFTTRTLRQWAGVLIGALMVLIGLTGNYGSFNLLGIVLCLTLFDDPALKSAGDRITEWIGWKPESESYSPAVTNRKLSKRYLLYIYFIIYLLVSLTQLVNMTGYKSVIPGWANWLNESIRSSRTINNYGLFANMTTKRPEIVVQGSNDGEHWRTYRFKYKPSRLNEPPTWVQPHMPRLDWQMWFAALGSYRQSPWIIQFLAKLLQNNKQVLNLLEKNPFPREPPLYVRAVLYRYQFTSLSQWWKTGQWWKREQKGMYVPAFSLKQLIN